MKTRSLVLALVFACALPVGFANAHNPIPGIGIVVKQGKCVTCPKCCSSKRIVIPGDFFGPGSEPFSGSVGMEGRCSHDCGGCDNDCAGNEGNPDGRIDYAGDLPAGPFEMIMQSTTMYSVAPIQVSINGVDSYFDVFVTVSGQGPQSDDPIPGMMLLPPGESLDTGTSSLVLSSFFDVHCTITFADASTGVAAGSPIESDLHIELQDSDLPVTRVADGTPGGRIVLGLSGSTVPFTYASADGELVMRMLSLYQPAPVPVEATSWGAVKAMYR